MAASSSSECKDEKLVFVRVKRKSSQQPLDAFLLEINERPVKRPLLDFKNLSISSSATGKEELKAKRLLVQHVETVSSSEATKDILQSFRSSSGNVNEFQMKLDERRHNFKQANRHDQLRSAARQWHEDLVKSARFEQIWKRRKENDRAVADDSIHEFCHLYDVVRVDVDERSSKTQETACLDDNVILCNYLPLMREFLPAVAAEIESDMASYASERDGYVYDLYAMGEDLSTTVECDPTMYPLIQVDEDDAYYDGPMESEYETDDSNEYALETRALLQQIGVLWSNISNRLISNIVSLLIPAEDNPLNDYPDEESSEDEAQSRSSYDRSTEEGSANEKEISDENEENDWRWEHRCSLPSKSPPNPHPTRSFFSNPIVD
ncbi:hypothetical protein ACLOJK_000287 [Asimina triloba]